MLSERDLEENRDGERQEEEEYCDLQEVFDDWMLSLLLRPVEMVLYGFFITALHDLSVAAPEAASITGSVFPCHV